MLFWVAERDGELVGFGVRAAWRRRGVGRALVDAMNAWMRAHEVAEVWVLADNDGAVAFYRACGFTVPDGQATYMTRVSATA